MIDEKTSFQISNLNLLKFEAKGNFTNKNFDVKVRSLLQNSSLFHKVFNLNANSIKEGFVDLILIFKNGSLKRINNLLINYDNNEFRSNLNFEQKNFLEIFGITNLKYLPTLNELDMEKLPGENQLELPIDSDSD